LCRWWLEMSRLEWGGLKKVGDPSVGSVGADEGVCDRLRGRTCLTGIARARKVIVTACRCEWACFWDPDFIWVKYTPKRTFCQVEMSG